MVHRFLLFIVTISVLFAVASCKNDGNKKNDSSKKTDTGRTTVVKADDNVVSAGYAGAERTVKAEAVKNEQKSSGAELPLQFSKTKVFDEYRITIEQRPWAEDCYSFGRVVVTVEKEQGPEVLDKSVFRSDGGVCDAWVTDLDGDMNPEIVIWSVCAGSGAYGTVTCYKFVDNKLRTFSSPFGSGDIELPGYSGHDGIAVLGNKLIRQFPIYKQGDTNAEPTGGTAQIVYSFTGRSWRRQVVARKSKGDNML